MTILGDALKLLMFFAISSSGLRLPGQPSAISLSTAQPSFTTLHSSDVIDYDGPVEDNFFDIAAETRSPQGWRIHPKDGVKPIGIMHIPKTAGSSFTLDAPKYLPKGVGLYAAESCLGQTEQQAKTDQIFTFVRDPVSHVYSEYLELADVPQMSHQIKDKVIMKSVTNWLEYFVSGDDIKKRDPGGYHPLDMQSRSFHCTHNLHHYEEVHLDQAIAGMHKATFVGITQYYHESMCLFFDKVQPEAALPDWCNCEDSMKWSQFKAHHDDPNKVRKHSLKDLSERDLEMIAKLTQKDEALYQSALNRFFHEVMDLEKRKNMKVYCGDPDLYRNSKDLEGYSNYKLSNTSFDETFISVSSGQIR